MTAPRSLLMLLLLAGCAAGPPDRSERGVRQQALDDAAQTCRVRYHDVVARYEITADNQLMAWYYDNRPQSDLEPFWACVRETLRAGRPAPPRWRVYATLDGRREAVGPLHPSLDACLAAKAGYAGSAPNRALDCDLDRP